jgi:hypothetical protein
MGRFRWGREEGVKAGLGEKEHDPLFHQWVVYHILHVQCIL